MFNIILSKKIKLFVIWFIWTISIVILLPALIEIFIFIFLRERIFFFSMDFSAINLLFLVLISLYNFLLSKAEGKYNKVVLTTIFSSIALLIPAFIKMLEEDGVKLLNKPLAEYAIFFYLSGLITPLLFFLLKKINSQTIIFNSEEINNENKILKSWKIITTLIISFLLIIYFGAIYIDANVPGFDIFSKKCSTVADCPSSYDTPGWKTITLCQNNKCRTSAL